MIDWFRGEIDFLHIPIPSGRVLSVLADGSIEWESVKALYCQGSYESCIKLKSSGGDGNGNATSLLIDGNIAKFLQGHNIFGSLDLISLVYLSFKKIYEENKEHITALSDINLTYKKIQKGNFLVKMLDVNFLYDVGSDESVESWLYAAEMNARTRGGRSCRERGTVYLQKTSRRWAFKFYNKFKEISSKSKKHQLARDLQGLGLEEFIKGKIRAEFRIMSLELKDRGLTHGKHLDKHTLIKLFNEYLGRINMTNQATLLDEKLLKLPRTLQASYQLWRQGASLSQLLPQRTFYRHRKLLLEHGVDITFPPDHSNSKNNVIPLMRVIEAVPVSIPDWAYEKGLIAA